MLEQTKAVIFDLDGTLMDSMWMWEQIDIEYLARYGYEPPAGLQTVVEGMSFTETAQYFKRIFAIPEEIELIKAEWNRMAYEKYAHAVRPKPGAAAFLAFLRRKGIPMAIASSNSRALIDACLSGNRMQDYFSCILTSCEVKKGKPAPDIYLSAAERLGVRPQDCLVFEDVPMGVLAGKNAGMRVCAVEDEAAAGRRQELRSLADYYIRSFDEIREHTYEVLS